ncbi:MAG: SUMF1/EgtB/PvdO family nonheme iron enzyme [Verrucomicrobiota bacterium]
MKIPSRTMSLGLGVMALGAIVAQGAAPVITSTAMVPRFTIQSSLGITNQIQYCTDLSQTNWLVLTNLVVTQSPYRFVDADAPPAPQRFYRVLVLGTNSPPPSSMALIPAGPFVMGDTLDGDSTALPLHTNQISAFYMDKYEVTKVLWNDVYNWAISRGYVFQYGADRKANNHPVYNVTWYDCLKWCNARSEKEGRRPAYYTDPDQTVVYRTAGNVSPYVNWNSGYRLPTEAEWEKAARGGVSGQRFPWGYTITWGEANYSANPSAYPYDWNSSSGYNPAFNDGVEPYLSPVGSFPANGYGLYDMAGNVSEWCWDWFDWPYPSGSQTDPRGPTGGYERVIRGGSWGWAASWCRAAFRTGGGSLNYRPGSGLIGFRSVLPPGQ